MKYLNHNYIFFAILIFLCSNLLNGQVVTVTDSYNNNKIINVDVFNFNKTKYFRERKKIKAYNAVIFNTESFLRKRDYLIPKICMAAINANKFNTKTDFGNYRNWV